MEDEQLEVSEDYKKWFNRGYRLREQFPEIAKGMTIPDDEPKEITQAIDAGIKQFEKDFGYGREQQKIKEREALKTQFQTKQKSREQGRER